MMSADTPHDDVRDAGPTEATKDNSSNLANMPEDEFDDDLLDDVLQGMVPGGSSKAPSSSAPKAPAPPASAHSAATSAATPGAAPEDDLDEDEFVKQLAAGMEQLMSGLQDAPELSGAMEEMMKSLEKPAPASKGASSTKTAADASAPASGGPAAGPQAAQSSFQDRIKQTMSKLQDSSDQAKAEMGNRAEFDPENMDTLMADMMKQMEQLADSGDFESVLEGMMESLLSKDILHEPLRDLAAKYPGYLEQNKDSLDPEQHAKYSKQLVHMREILAIYDSGTDTQEAEAKRVVTLMTEIQELGQPPAELLKELAPGMDVDEATGQFKAPAGASGQHPPECNQM